MERGPGQLLVTVELWADVSTHGFWKRGTPAVFDVKMVNLHTVSYLSMLPKNALTKSEK